MHAEGAFWRYVGAHWTVVPEHALRRAIHAYDGASFVTATGGAARVKLSRGRVNSALSELAAQRAHPEFFTDAAPGINSASGLTRFADDGTPRLEPHDPAHRCRHALPGHWQPGTPAEPPVGSLLHRLLDGVFRGDADAREKVDLLAEIAGAAALGHATKLRNPRAIILKGDSAGNGKSQILDVIRGLLPASAIGCVPIARMGDERHIIWLAGKLLNATDELSSAAAIASDTFKAVVPGDPVQGRDVYKSRIEFRPIAQHLFATNVLPPFKGGMDRGVLRRLLVVPFHRVIPDAERIEALGRRIAVEEPDLVLAWAVAGAGRLIRQREFAAPASSRAALTDWVFGADPVIAWLAQNVTVQPGGPWVRTREAYWRFRQWAIDEGYAPRAVPDINAFTQRVKASATGLEHRRVAKGAYFIGLIIRPTEP